MRGRLVRCWHPESPGSTVVLWRPWWRRKARPFATHHEMTIWHHWNADEITDVRPR